MTDNTTYDDVQHGIDNDPNNDAKKGAELGAMAGAVTGAVAGSLAGPVGAIVGAVIGGVAGAVGSGAAVAVVDRIDNDNTVSGLGSGESHTLEPRDEDVDFQNADRSPIEEVSGSVGAVFSGHHGSHRRGACHLNGVALTP